MHTRANPQHPRIISLLLIAFMVMTQGWPAGAQETPSGRRSGPQRRDMESRSGGRDQSRGSQRSQPQTFEGRPVQPGTIVPMRVKKPYLFPTAATPTTQTFPIPPVVMKKPLGIGLTGPETAAFADRHLRPGDLVIFVNPEDVGLLTSGTAASRGIIIRGSDLDRAEQTIKWARENGIRDVALNLDGLPREELVARQRNLCQLARLEGLRFTFGPKVTDLQSGARELTQWADMIMIQTQRYQGGMDYARKAGELIAQVRAANPRVKVWVQVSMAPPYAPQVTGEQVLEDILDVAETADGIFVYYPPEKWDTTRRVLEALRPLDTTGLVDRPQGALASEH